MKTLIMCSDSRGWIQKIWLYSLRNKAKYTGDILIVDAVGDLGYLANNNTFIVPSKRVYENYAVDRFRAYLEYLEINRFKYDIIASIDGDVEFIRPIDPLFELSKNDLCCVKTNIYGKTIATWKSWAAAFKAMPQDFLDSYLNELDFCMGMFVGPTDLMYIMIKCMCKLFEWNSEWGADELWFNIMHYYYGFPVKSISCEWDWLVDNFKETHLPNLKPNILHYGGIGAKERYMKFNNFANARIPPQEHKVKYKLPTDKEWHRKFRFPC